MRSKKTVIYSLSKLSDNRMSREKDVFYRLKKSEKTGRYKLANAQT
jgi:hypothetical protein